ncbi:UNKNOWN [Stylonychia lemnae]|uniref:Homeobox domain-containing protein n=1 Tax=Stylonychia lemnae TaxID=5949 RepID=A0A077ZS72_STYLE|nr:UNKNOWN [Stylonychia lemnae]|eukprot:CDW72727.1 UNKNOWN [Stylonychia lemnae]
MENSVNFSIKNEMQNNNNEDSINIENFLLNKEQLLKINSRPSRFDSSCISHFFNDDADGNADNKKQSYQIPLAPGQQLHQTEQASRECIENTNFEQNFEKFLMDLEDQENYNEIDDVSDSEEPTKDFSFSNQVANGFTLMKCQKIFAQEQSDQITGVLNASADLDQTTGKRKISKSAIPKQQLQILRKLFEINPKWSKTDMVQISQETGLSFKKVYKWQWDRTNQKDLSFLKSMRLKENYWGCIFATHTAPLEAKKIFKIEKLNRQILQ